MKPIGKVLCAAGVVAGLTAFFWKDDFNPESLSGAHVLVTGASAGIGEQIAYHYARFGAEIVLTARREAVLQKVMEKCLTLGAKKIFYIPADMSSPSEPERVVQFAVQKHPGHLFGFRGKAHLSACPAAEAALAIVRAGARGFVPPVAAAALLPRGSAPQRREPRATDFL